MAQKKDYNKRALALHKKLRGKLETKLKHPLKNKDDWSTMYSPGVGAVAAHLATKPEDARLYTAKGNSVAIISDGSAVLGLGNIGPEGALPVMEGKAAILKAMANIDAWPIVLDTQDVDEVVATIKHIAPSFGAINLEDFAAPACFAIEERLKQELTIPVMHDDQHGTAIAVLAGLINAAKVVNKKVKDMRVVVVGSGAAGRAITLLLLKYGIGDVVVADRQGLLCTARTDLSGHKRELAQITNQKKVCGDIADVTCGADVLVGVSGPGTLKPEFISCMARDPIVFALANPIPEITPEGARAAGAAIVATGRSDYPNQINNALVFPGIFRGALDKKVSAITDDMKIAAAKKIASLVAKPHRDQIVPPVSHPQLVQTVAGAVK